MLVESVMAASFDLIEANIATTCDRYGMTNPDFYYSGFVDDRDSFFLSLFCSSVNHVDHGFSNGLSLAKGRAPRACARPLSDRSFF